MTTATRIDADELAELLARLGPTPAAVAESLRDAGITGCRESANGCPVARYLRQRGANAAVVSIADTAIISDNNSVPVAVLNPAAVSRFIEDFDAGGWPELSNGEWIQHGVMFPDD